MTQFPCVSCGECDGHTNGGALFCWSCHDNASVMAKDVLFSAYVDRMSSLKRDMDDWEQEAA